jgi:DNA-binding MarR family transcriptional regulator
MPVKSQQPVVGREWCEMKKSDVDPGFCNNSVLRQAARRLGQHYDEALAASGLKATQQGLLAQVVFLGEPTMRQLADALIMDLSAVGHSLQPLVRDGFVELVPDERDRRAKRVRMTVDGEKRFMKSMRMWQDAQRRFESAFGPAKAAQLRTALAYIASEEFAEILAAQGEH